LFPESRLTSRSRSFCARRGGPLSPFLETNERARKGGEEMEGENFRGGSLASLVLQSSDGCNAKASRDDDDALAENPEGSIRSSASKTETGASYATFTHADMRTNPSSCPRPTLSFHADRPDEEGMKNE